MPPAYWWPSSSHHNTVERQFRFPIEQGVQRPPYAQWTVTGSGALALADQGEGPVVTMGTAGKVVDLGISDPNNMGAAMAPAAADTLISHFQDTGTAPEDYDLILTGDLGMVGSEALKELMRMHGYLLEENYQDCGMLIYDLMKQDVHAGAAAAAVRRQCLPAASLPAEEGGCRRVLLTQPGR